MDRPELTMDYSLIVNQRLVDDNFNVLPAANDFIEFTKNELENKNVTIVVDSTDMISTAIFLSMRKRINVNLYVELHDFSGSNFVDSFLKSAYVKEVIYK